MDDIESPRGELVPESRRHGRPEDDPDAPHPPDAKSVEGLLLWESRVVARQHGDLVALSCELRRQTAHVRLHAADVRMEPRGHKPNSHRPAFSESGSSAR